MAEIMKNIRNSDTFRLIKGHQTFVEGIASILDVGGNIINKYNTDEADDVADYNSLQADWNAVGKDMYSALNEYAKNSNN